MVLDYTVPTSSSYREAVDALVDASEAAGFRVLAVHDVTATLAEKGFEREPVSIIEVCNARYASAVLAQDPKIGLMLPCPLMVFEQGGQVFLATMRPTLIGDFFPDADLGDVPEEVERILVSVLDEVAALGGAQ
ncbi:MAG: DUF302 domain-containing protein [Coriobacteriia bacterium]|nr:DUF302 domain-containing protein [Coriobacteriia bacterium]